MAAENKGARFENTVNEDGFVSGGFYQDIGIDITWQKGPMDVERNGATMEDVILAILVRLEAFQNTGLKCAENDEAMDHLRKAKAAFDRRTAARREQDVEGKYENHEEGASAAFRPKPIKR